MNSPIPNIHPVNLPFRILHPVVTYNYTVSYTCEKGYLNNIYAKRTET